MTEIADDPIAAAVDAVAARLGNTRAVCRASCIHPAILPGYQAGTLCGFTDDGGVPDLDDDERWTLAYLTESEVVSRKS